MEETYGGPWRGAPDRLARDAFGSHLSIAVAESNEEVVGFVAWTATYDLHHCFPGIEVLDLFVGRSFRGRGVAVGLLVSAAAHASRTGATFLSGGAVLTGSGTRLYERASIRHGDRFHLSGRAFRALAVADATSPRSLAKCLPPREWNFEA